MKNVLLISALVIFSSLHSQTRLDSLQKENRRLKAEIENLKNLRKPVIQSANYSFSLPEITLNDINFKIIKVSGDKKTGNVEVLMFLRATKINESILLKDITANTSETISNTKIPLFDGTIGVEKLNLKINENIQVLVNFNNISKDSGWLRSLKFTGKIVNGNSTKTLAVEFKDLQIRWD